MKRKVSYTQEYLKEAHQHCRLHREDVIAGKCGCFYCLRVFDGTEVHRWIDRNRGASRSHVRESNTAICPHCHLDMVLPENRGLPIDDPEFLKAMNEMWVQTQYDINEIRAAKAEGRDPVPVER